jgi:hypothetical protein
MLYERLRLVTTPVVHTRGESIFSQSSGNSELARPDPHVISEAAHLKGEIVLVFFPRKTGN